MLTRVADPTWEQKWRGRRLLIAAVLVAVAYYAASRLGLALTFTPAPVSTFWASNAVLMAGLLLVPTRRWGWLLLAAALAHFAVQLAGDVPLLMATCWYVSNCLEALIGAAFVRALVPGKFTLDRFANVGMFLGFCVFLAPFLSSFLDAAFVALNNFGGLPYWDVWKHRLFSNTLATLIVVPPIVAAASLPTMRPLTPRRVLEAALLAVGLVAVSIFVFGQARSSYASPALLYAPLPLLVWAAVRFGPAGISMALLFIVITSIWNAVNGVGPFIGQSAERNAISIQLFFFVAASTLLSLAALLEERQKAETTARHRGAQLQLALDAAQMQTWEWDAAGARQWLKAAQYLLAGRESEAVIYFEGFDGAVHPGDLERVAQALSDSLEIGASFRVEFRVVTTDARIRWVAARGKTMRDVHGNAARLIGLTADITERKRTEHLMKAENRILKMIASGASTEETLGKIVKLVEAETPDGVCSIVVLDPDGRHIRHAAANSLPPAYIEAINGLAIGPSAGSCGTAMYLKRPVIVTDINEDALWRDYRYLAQQHGLRACWSLPIISDHGHVLGSLATYYTEPRGPTDSEFALHEIAVHLATIVLERGRAERDAHAQEEALEHLSRVAILGELSGALAHELTQPLTAVLSNAQAAQRLLQRTPLDTAELNEIIDDIVAADLRASAVIRSLRPMLLKGHAETKLLDVNQLLFDTIKLARSGLAARDVTITTVPVANAPPILGDRVQLQQVLLNLIINACDAMNGCSRFDRHLTCATQCSNDGSMVEVSISDCGTGISPDVMNRIFDPFFTSKRDGLGLGLSICRSIMQAHQGKLWAVNNSGRGATFNLALPVAPVDVIRTDIEPGGLHPSVF